MAQTFQEALADKTMFDPPEAAVTTADAFGAQDRDIDSHGPTVEESKPLVHRDSCPSRGVADINSYRETNLTVITRFASLTSITCR